MLFELRTGRIQHQRYALGDLCYLQGVCQAISEEVGLMAGKQLGFTLEPSK